MSGLDERQRAAAGLGHRRGGRARVAARRAARSDGEPGRRRSGRGLRTGRRTQSDKETASGTVSVAQMTGMSPGSKATVRGLYLGWRGPCQGAPPTRSAWQLADNDQKGAACLYVDGPAPAASTLPDTERRSGFASTRSS